MLLQKHKSTSFCIYLVQMHLCGYQDDVRMPQPLIAVQHDVNVEWCGMFVGCISLSDRHCYHRRSWHRDGDGESQAGDPREGIGITNTYHLDSLRAPL